MKDSSSRFVASYLVKFKGRINFLRLMQNAYYFFFCQITMCNSRMQSFHIFFIGSGNVFTALFLVFKYVQTIIYSIHRGPIIKSNKRKEAMITAPSLKIFFCS